MLLEIKNDINEITRVCDLVKDFCNSNSISGTGYHNVILILDEMLTNIISYAFQDGKEHTFTLKIEKKGKCVCIELIDEGVPFDPLKQQTPDIEADISNRKIGGLGIFLAKQLSEKMEYQRLNNENHLKIRVSTENKEESDGSKE
ncbi:MAG: ATP-binding protein [Alphaproteobacteria bacterium]|nr:ATP-binding protein [Alphaproteobacteria bacterium]